MRVIFVDDFGAPVAGTVYEELLTRLPDNEITRSYVKLSDFAGTLELLGIERVRPITTRDEILSFVRKLGETTIGGFQSDLPPWPDEVELYSTKPEWHQYAAFDVWDVDQSAYAALQYSSKSDQHDRRLSYDFAFGPFDPAATADALAACQCDQPVMVVHLGVEFYTWGEEGVGTLQSRYDPPLYDQIGRGPRLLVKQGEAYWTFFDDPMRDLIDVQSGTLQPLSANQDFVDAVQRMLSLGFMRDITIRASGMSLEQLSDNGFNDSPAYESVVRAAPLMEHFTYAAEGVGFDGERAFTGLVIGHSDNETAERNAELFVERIRTVQRQISDSEVWAESYEKVEVSVEGSTVLARLYSRNPELHSFGFPIITWETLLVHE